MVVVDVMINVFVQAIESAGIWNGTWRKSTNASKAHRLLVMAIIAAKTIEAIWITATSAPHVIHAHYAIVAMVRAIVRAIMRRVIVDMC